MKKRHIDDDDLRRIIEKAHQLTNAEQNRLSLEDVKKTAEELGISSQKVNLAYNILEEEKKEKIRRKNFLRKLYIRIAVIAPVVIAISYWILAPAPPPETYQGKIKMTLATTLDEANPKDEIKEVRLFQHKKIYSFLKLLDIDRRYEVEWKFIDPSGELFDETKQTVTPKNGTATTWATLKLPMSTPIGDWNIEVWIGGEKYQSFPMKVDYGYFTAKLASKLGTTKRKTPEPEDVKDVYTKGEDELVLCYLYWGLLSKDRAGEVAWKWIDPNGEVVREGILKTDPSLELGWYRANHGLKVDDAEVGKWKVEVYYADVKIKTLDFTIQ